MTQDLVILSPEKTILSYRLAGLGSRFWAQLIDIFLIGMSLGVLSQIATTAAVVLGSLPIFFLAVLAAAYPFLYFLVTEALFNGVTPGKKAMGIRVRMADGTAITATAAITRNLLRVADLLPGTYFLGMISMFLNPKCQRIGDLAAGTIVIQERLTQPRLKPTPYALGVHRFEGLVGDLRGMTREDYDALRRMCDRYPEFSAAVQARMIRDLWKPVAARLGIPEQGEIPPILLAEATVMKYGRTHGLL